MAYSVHNYKTKKQLKEAVQAYLNNPQQNPPVRAYQPGGIASPDLPDGNHCIEGPHYPEPHKWYATCTVKNGIITKVR
jgi:hypothetical protein